MKKTSFKKLMEVFVTFLKIGAFTFGGGYAMIPLMQREAVQKHHWISDEEILDILAIAESTPGPVSINMATFVGYRTCGVMGSVFATLGSVLPSFATILLVSYVLQEFQDNLYVQYAFTGLRAGVLALILQALWKMYKKCPKSGLSYCIMGGAFILVALFKFPVLPVLIGCAAAGLISLYLMEKRAGKK